MLVLSASAAWSDGLKPADGSPGADVLFDVPCTVPWVAVGGNSEPFFPDGSGRIIVGLADSVEVITPEPSGLDNFHCHGKLPPGGQAVALDISTGKIIVATLASRDEACATFGAISPGTCRGRNGPLVISTDTTPFECFTEIDGEIFLTDHARSITTASGATSVSCHFDLDEEPVAAVEKAGPRVTKRKQIQLRDTRTDTLSDRRRPSPTGNPGASRKST